MTKSLHYCNVCGLVRLIESTCDYICCRDSIPLPVPTPSPPVDTRWLAAQVAWEVGLERQRCAAWVVKYLANDNSYNEPIAVNADVLLQGILGGRAVDA